MEYKCIYYEIENHSLQKCILKKIYIYLLHKFTAYSCNEFNNICLIFPCRAAKKMTNQMLFVIVRYSDLIRMCRMYKPWIWYSYKSNLHIENLKIGNQGGVGRGGAKCRGVLRVSAMDEKKISVIDYFNCIP